MLGAIQQITDRAGESSRHRDGHGGIVLIGVQASLGRGGGAGQEDQLGGVAAVQGQFDDAGLIHHLADAGAVSFHHAGVRLDHDFLAERADLKGCVDHRVAVHLKHDSGLDESVEPVLGDGEAIRPHGKTGQNVSAVGSGLHGPSQARGGLVDGDLRA